MRLVRFWLQPTASFDQAPQREEYASDQAFITALYKYDAEWRALYKCIGCTDEPGVHRRDCPEPDR